MDCGQACGGVQRAERAVGVGVMVVVAGMVVAHAGLRGGVMDRGVVRRLFSFNLPRVDRGQEGLGEEAGDRG